MYRIYFKNIKGEYHAPIYKETNEEAFAIANIYWKFVPSLLITDSNDLAILEVKDGNILHLSKNDIDFIEKIFYSNTESIPYIDIKKLLTLYQDTLTSFQSLKNKHIANKLIELDINLLALAAKENINLYKSGYINSEFFIDSIGIDANSSVNEYFHSFQEDINNNQTLVIMPITRVIFDENMIIDKYHFISPKSINYKELFAIENSLFNNETRTLIGNLTGFSLDILDEHYCIAFTYNLNWDEFKSYTHNNDDVTLLKILSSQTDELLNLIKFNRCKLNLPDTLPGEVGAWTNSNDYLGALLFNKSEGSFLISGSAIESSRVVKGIGLDIHNIESIGRYLYFLKNDSEVSKVTRYALSLFNDALYSNSNTIKFIKMMRLYEYLAYPDEFKRFQDVKKYIICHYAKSKDEYKELSDRFLELSKEYRTEIVHNGKTLEMIIQNFEERQKLFDELESYFRNVIFSMINFDGETWEEFINYRKILIANFS